jgi:DNA polymerase-3 subunit epsilon
MAREMHPGQRNSLDALCKRYEVDATKRDVHGALIDSELLANVYLAMTGGQTAMLLDEDVVGHHADPGREMMDNEGSRPGAAPTEGLPVIKASADESAAHEDMLEKIRKSGACVWDID